MAVIKITEATLEASLQVVLQLYIIAAHYENYMTVGSPLGQFTYQMYSVITSLTSLVWSFTSYHVMTKEGGLEKIGTLLLMFALLFQVTARITAFTIFSLVYTWRVCFILALHYVIVLPLKNYLEERTRSNDSNWFSQVLSFRMILSTLASTFVYFRLEKKSADEKKPKLLHSTFLIHSCSLLLAFVENMFLLYLGLTGLDPDKYEEELVPYGWVVGVAGHFIGVVLQIVYYKLFGHPWTCNNGPKLKRNRSDKSWTMTFYRYGEKWEISHKSFVIFKCQPVNSENALVSEAVAQREG